MPPVSAKAVVALLIATAIAFAAPATAADKKAVTITGHNDATYAFKPDKLRVDKGTTVHWNWDSNAPHNVTFSQLDESSDTVSSGSYKLRFNKAGTFKYVCSVHGFKGKVIVG